MTKFLNISTDNTLGGSSASDSTVSSQKAVKEYVDTGLDTQNGTISNCILKIPQNIKASISNGVLTIFSGSKVYIPNGSGVYNEFTFTADKTASTGLNEGINVICCKTAYSGLLARPIANCVSGAGVTTTSGFAYDTTANTVGFYNNSGVLAETNCSFPLCLVNVENGVITGFAKDSNGDDMIFNGVGFVGQTKFLLPDVKVLQPIGYNSDGTLKSREYTNNSLQLVTQGGTYNRKMYLNGDAFQITNNPWYYDENTNFWYNQDNNPFVNGCVCLGDCYTVNDIVTDFTIRQPVRLATTAFVKAQNYLQQADQGNLLPNFDSMAVLQTIEFDTADSDYHVICTRTNTDSSDAELNDILYFRITVTGTSINQVGNYAVILPGRINNQPFVIANMFPGTTDSAYGGCRYLRYVYPKALNNGYGWEICVMNNRNTSARHYKVEVFKTNSKITWKAGTATTYDGTYQAGGNIDVETRYGYIFNYMYGAVTDSNNATQLNGRLTKFINSTINTAGAALLASQFVYQNGNSIYPATDKTKAIEPSFGIQLCNAAYNSGNSVGWDQLRQKMSVTSLTNIPHATLARGNPCYFRCTMDANGNILSDNYVATSMANGYTWYYVGIAQSTTAIALDTTQSFFMTLDSNGKLTHVNGKPIINTDTKNTAGSTDTSSKIFLVGATSQAASPQTYSHDTAFVDANGRINSAAPATDANDTTVATTKWVKDQSYITSSGSITGSAAKLTTKRTIDGVEFDGSANITHYGTCSTAAATQEKAVACTGFKLETGAIICVRFTAEANGASNPTLNVNSTGAKAIRYRNSAIDRGYLRINRTYIFVYDGTYYQLIGDLDTNNYDRLIINNSIKAETAITVGRAIVGTSAGYKNIGSGITFDISYPILYAGSNIDASAEGNSIYRAIPSRSIRDLTGNSSWTGTQYATVYLVLSALDGVNATIDSTLMTTTVPSSADNKFYIPIGYTYSTYQCYFCPQDKIYAYTNGAFQEVVIQAIKATQDGSGNTITTYYQPKLTSGTNIKTINGSSVLGSGDLTISASSSWGGITGTLSNQTDLQTALNGKQTTANLVTSVSSSSTDSQYPSAKLFYDTCGDIETLINAL